MEQDLSEVAVEINSIFDNMSLVLLNKIPTQIQIFFRKVASSTYKFTYDTTKSLNEQNIKDKTRGVIAFLYRNYICNEDEKRAYNNIYFNYLNAKEEEKRKLYNPDTIFQKKTDTLN